MREDMDMHAKSYDHTRTKGEEVSVGNGAEDMYNHASKVNSSEVVNDITHTQTDTSIAITLTLLLAHPVGAEEKKKKRERGTDV